MPKVTRGKELTWQFEIRFTLLSQYCGELSYFMVMYVFMFFTYLIR